MEKTKQRSFYTVVHVGSALHQREATPFFGLHLSDEQISQIIHHATEGVGVRATAGLSFVQVNIVRRFYQVF